MSKSKEPYDKSKNGTGKTSENNPENELLKDFDEGRRSFLIKLLITATYVTPAILSFSMRDLEARRRRRRRPTKKERKKKRRRRRR